MFETTTSSMNGLNKTIRTHFAHAIFCFLIFGHNNILAQNNHNDLYKSELTIKNVVFEENKGQVSDQNFLVRNDVLFVGKVANLMFHLKKNGISYQLNQINELPEITDESSISNAIHYQTTSYRLDLNWLNINQSINIIPENRLKYTNNYYLEHCPEGVLNVPSYQNIIYRDLYPGINLKWYEHENQLKYDYICSPNSDYRNIQTEVKGAKSISVNQIGQLIIETPLGLIVEEAPIVLQDDQLLPSRWIVSGDILSFEIDSLDPSKAYVIDPIVRNWGTYYGGTALDQGYNCDVDTNGFVYLVGETQSATQIATSGSHQQTYATNVDAYLVKYDSLGVRQWATYYGGSIQDHGRIVKLDPSGNIFLAGKTNSTNAISTAGCHQPTKGSSVDAFLVKFNSSGVRLWGTYYGGGGTEGISGCATDSVGNVYISGYTTSTTGISTPGSHQQSSGGLNEAFLAKFDGNGIRQWGTYYGGSGDELGTECTLDNNNNIIMTGTTSSTTNISTIGSHQEVYAGGNDAFMVQFNDNGVRQWGTYFGGPNYDYGFSCKSATNGTLFFSGSAISTSGVSTIGAYQENHGGGTSDGFLTSFTNTGQRIWGTYFGGSANDEVLCFLDEANNVFLVGSTYSAGLSTSDGFQTAIGGGQDGLLAKFKSNGVLLWSTYYGGANTDGAYCGVSDKQGKIYIAGSSSSTTAIATNLAHQSSNGGSSDGFLVQFSNCADQLASIMGPIEICEGSTNSYSVLPDAGVNYYTWSIPNGWSGSSSSNSISITANDTAGDVQVFANTVCGLTDTSLLTISINQLSNFEQSIVLCNGEALNVGNNSYSISGNYIDTLTNIEGCDSIVTTILTFENPLNITTTVTGITISSDSIFDSYQWIDCSNNAAIANATQSSYTPNQNGSYALIGFSGGCRDTSLCQTIATIGLTEQSENAVTLFPNPVSSNLNINSSGLIVEYAIYNLHGEQLMQKDNVNEMSQELLIESLSNGVYFARVYLITGQIIFRKFVVSHER